MKFGMKKKFLLTLALSAIFAGTAFAAEVNPFDDVPTNHWAYAMLLSVS